MVTLKAWDAQAFLEASHFRTFNIARAANKHKPFFISYSVGKILAFGFERVNNFVDFFAKTWVAFVGPNADHVDTLVSDKGY